MKVLGFKLVVEVAVLVLLLLVPTSKHVADAASLRVRAGGKSTSSPDEPQATRKLRASCNDREIPDDELSGRDPCDPIFDTPDPYWEVITFDDFEDGWGNFKDVGKNQASDKKDAARVSNVDSGQQAYVHRGNAALRIRDNAGKESSVWHKEDHDVSGKGYKDLRVVFWFAARGFQTDKSFLLEYSSDGGQNYTEVKRFVSGPDADFENDVIYKREISFNEAFGRGNYARTNQARIRFRCDADGDENNIYIDSVKFSGWVLYPRTRKLASSTERSSSDEHEQHDASSSQNSASRASG